MVDIETIAEEYAKHGSIRKTATALGYAESTLRLWAEKDARIRRVLYPNEPRFEPIQVPAAEMKLLCIDIETRPNIALVWDLWSKSGVPPAAVLNSTSMISWAAKWIGDPAVEFRSVFHDGHDKMVKDVWVLLNEADAVIHYNGQKFDVPYINMEFARLGLLPPSPFKQIDLLKIVRKCFNFPSNKLALVSKEFGLEGKIENEGFPLWIKCMNDDPEAWARMKDYNIRDTELLEPLYYKLRPWASGLPSYGALLGENVCPACGSYELQSRGNETTRTGRYQRFHCQNCGKWSRAVKRNAGTGVTSV